jgi:tRNA threonylcarbamoyladenosine biosynthesis protein TsaE
MSLFLPDEAATIAFAARLHTALPADVTGWTILLEGELGTGKSTLVRALIRAMGHSGAVPSPTYTLVEPYVLPRGKLYHIDLYRISSADELRFLGWNELDDGFRLVEWPDRAPQLLSDADLQIRLSYQQSGRDLALAGLSERGELLAAELS